MYSYKRDECDGRWLLCCDGEITHSSKELYIAYSKMEHDGKQLCSVVKHGSKENIDAWRDRNFNKYRLADIDLPIIIAVDDSITADKVNYILDRSCIREDHFQNLTHPPLEALVISSSTPSPKF